VVDGGGLENHCGGNSTGGSNPSPSANIRKFWPICPEKMVDRSVPVPGCPDGPKQALRLIVSYHIPTTQPCGRVRFENVLIAVGPLTDSSVEIAVHTLWMQCRLTPMMRRRYRRRRRLPSTYSRTRVLAALRDGLVKTVKTEQNTRTSLNLPPALVMEARAIAIRERTSLSHVIADYLRQYVRDHARAKK
jgi:hypothetical protein